MPESDFLRAIRISEDAVKACNLQDAPDRFAYAKIQKPMVPTLHQESKTEERGAYISIKNSIFVHNLYIP